MVKIFPFYKGECISKTETGYSSVRNARQRMNDEKVRADFDNTLPDEYWFEHSYVYLLDKPWNETISPETCRNASTSCDRFGLVYYTDGYTKSGSKTMFGELPEDVREMFRKKELISGYAEEDATEYRETVYAILKKGYYPHLFRDTSDYKKNYSDFVNKNVEFREMNVEIRVYE